ncbi:MAG: hypothetical protein ACTSVI_08200 [Promethearchaeota archaeon]
MRSEDIIFYFDLSISKKDVVHGNTIVSQVKRFIKQKEKLNPNYNWGVIAFKKDEKLAFLEALAEDDKGIDKFLKNNLKFTVKSHPLEQGLMLASTYLIEAFRTTKDNHMRVIVISDGPTEGSNVDIAKALLELLDKIKYFPLFIDIIRVGSLNVYPDDVRLKFITSKTGGTLNYASSDDEFKKVMNELLRLERDFPSTPAIPEEFRDFYRSLCFNLEYTNRNGKCILCNGSISGSGEALVSCENCKVLYHLDCAKKHASSNNIGLRGIFRCLKCDCLLSIDKVREKKLETGSYSRESTSEKPVFQQAENNLGRDNAASQEQVAEQENELKIDGDSGGIDDTTDTKTSVTRRTSNEIPIREISFKAPIDSINDKSKTPVLSSRKLNDDILVLDDDGKIIRKEDSSREAAKAKVDMKDFIVILDKDDDKTPFSFWKKKKKKS